jgi:hypothetical protein
LGVGGGRGWQITRAIQPLLSTNKFLFSSIIYTLVMIHILWTRFYQ